MSAENVLQNWSQFATFPCKQNTKIPATRQGFKDAKFGQDVMAFIMQGYNVGLALSTSGLIALDLDYHNENATPEEDLKNLEIELNSKLPKTLTQSTASGNGKHFIYSAKGITNPIGRIGKFCDLKYNGYIIIAPSAINNRQYRIIDGIDKNGKFIISELSQPWLNYINKDTKVNKKQAQTIIEPKLYNNIDIERIFNNCTFLRHCRDNAEILSEPEWHTMITILAQIENSDELIHSLSEPFPKYSFEETKKKIENARRFGKSQSCKYISGNYPEICGNCSYAKNMKEV